MGPTPCLRLEKRPATWTGRRGLLTAPPPDEDDEDDHDDRNDERGHEVANPSDETDVLERRVDTRDFQSALHDAVPKQRDHEPERRRRGGRNRFEHFRNRA